MNDELVEQLEQLSLSADRIAEAIRPNSAPGRDGYGVVDSLTEAVMGVTHGLRHIAESISDLASAVREHSKPKSQQD